MVCRCKRILNILYTINVLKNLAAKNFPLPDVSSFRGLKLNTHLFTNALATLDAKTISVELIWLV